MKTLFLLLLLLVTSLCHAEFVTDINVGSRPDLEKGIVVRQSTCMAGKQKLLCVAVKVDDKLYVVYIDGKGEHSIYWISPKGDILIYSRGSV